MTHAYRIYIIAPADSNLSNEQLAVKKSIVGAIKKEGFEPQEFFSMGIPKTMPWSFAGAEMVMSRCQGAAILAFARWLATPTVNPAAQEVYLPSEYAHFEGALAFSRRLPRLVITDPQVRTAGITLLSEGPVIFWPEGVGAEGIGEAWFRGLFDAWADEVRSRPHVLGYCSSARSTASELTLFMEHELGLRVQNYAMDFSAGPTIYEQIEAVARICACGVFLFTKDDPLEGRGGAAPRDNVVFEGSSSEQMVGNELRSFEKRAPRCPLISAETSTFPSRTVPIFRQSIPSYDDSSKMQCDASRLSSDQANAPQGRRA